MTEFNVDTAGREALEAAAADLGVKFRADVKDDTLRAKIKEALGEGGDTEPSPEPEAAPAKKAKRRAEIIIATHERDRQPVPVGVNGKTYLIKRGEKAIVPESVVKVLNNAVQYQYDPKTMERQEVLSYPFQVVRWIEE